MLTKKQLWRRTNSKSRHRLRNNASVSDQESQQQQQFLSPSSSSSSNINSDPFSSSASSSSATAGAGAKSPSPIKLKSALSHGNLADLERKIKQSRILRFSATVHVLLIPSRVEIISHCMNVYYKSQDYIEFKQEAIQEIRALAKLYNLPVQAITNYLYQPNYELLSQSSSDCNDDNEDSNDENTIDFYENSSTSTTSSSLSSPHDFAHENEIGEVANRFESIQTSSSSSSSTSSSSSSISSDLKFIENAKTDVELHEQHSAGGRSAINKSGTGTPTLRQHAWVVQWKKQPNHTPPTGSQQATPPTGSVSNITIN